MGHDNDNDNDNACLRLFDCYYYVGLGVGGLIPMPFLNMNECKLVVQCCIPTYLPTNQWMDGWMGPPRVAHVIRRCRGKFV